jgi:hypothetical protein
VTSARSFKNVFSEGSLSTLTTLFFNLTIANKENAFFSKEIYFQLFLKANSQQHVLTSRILLNATHKRSSQINNFTGGI